MAKRDKISFDKTEISLYDDYGSRPRILNLTYDRITSIQFDRSSMRVFGILKKPTDRIMFQIRGLELPVFLYRAREGEDFDRYMEGLRKFARENRITLRDELSPKE